MEFSEINTERALSNGPLLSTLCQIDLEFPSLGRYFLSGSQRQHVVAAALSVAIMARGAERRIAFARLAAVSPDLEIGPLLAAVGQAISKERGAALIRRAYGEVPHGYIAALGKCGSANSKFYLDLFRIFHLPEHRKLAKLLQYESCLQPRLIRVALMLPPYLCVGNFLNAAIRANVEELLAAVELIKEICPLLATEEALAASIPRGNVSVHSWIAGWTAKASLPPAPIPGDDLLTPLMTVAEMQTLGREMRNCLHSRSISALSGKSSYLRARINDAPYVVELEKIGSNFSVGGIYASRNLPVPTEVERALTTRLAAKGMLPASPFGGDNDRWEPLRRALRNAPLTEEDFYQPDWMA